MRRIIQSGRWLWMLVGLFVATIAVAAPIVNLGTTIPDETRGLANLRRMSLSVTLLPQAMLDAGLTEKGLHGLVKARLTEGGFEITDEDTTPAMVITSLTMVDRSVPEVVGFVIFFDIKQKVRIYRLEMDLVVPIATLSAHGVKKKKNLSEGVNNAVVSAMDNFAKLELDAPTNR